MDNFNDRKIIPIVFACSNTFIKILAVAIQSIREHSSPEYYYDIYVLYNSNTYFDLGKAYRIYGILKKNMGLHFIDIKDNINHSIFRGYAHVSEETCYRLLIPEVITQYEKVIYLDCDLVVLRDLKELFETDISTYAFAAVKEELNIYQKEYVQTRLGVPADEYINAGIMLINMELFRSKRLKENYIAAIRERKHYRYPEQDVLNQGCRGQILFLDVKWNIRWYLPKDQKYDMAVVHYASRIKPWNKVGILYENYFWIYARKSLFYREILNEREEALHQS
ncbi:MAG: glycosyltransferase family 8 protein [bacterium]|nr:glycosyltransferase family 8 protein [bacterium]